MTFIGDMSRAIPETAAFMGAVEEDAELLPPPDSLTDAEAIGSVSGVSSTRAESRDAAEARDAALVASAAATLGGLSDPMILQQLVQTWLRDLGLELRETSAETAAERAGLEGERAVLARDEARVAAERAANEGFIAQVCGYIGSGVAIIAGAVGAAFSGGASLVAAVAAVVLIVGALTTQILCDTKVVCESDREGAGWAGFGMSVAATICSFGAAAGGAAASGASAGAKIAVETGSAAARAAADAAATAARAAAEATKLGLRCLIDTLNYASSAAQTVAGGAGIASAASGHESASHGADAEVASGMHDGSTTRMESEVDAARELMRTFARLAAALAGVREATDESRRAARLRA